MSTRLVILGILKDRPLHGYEIKHIIEEHMGDWTSIAFGSIYFALGKMHTEGLIEQISGESVGNRPARTVYRITPEGRTCYLNLLREAWRKEEREYYSLDVALAFSKDLPKEEVMDYIRQRLASFEKKQEYLEIHKNEQLSRPEVPEMARAVFNHAEYHMKAESEWLRAILADFEKGILP